MANFTIMRNGLNAEIIEDSHVGQSSENITVAVNDDGTYSGYTKKLYYSYCYHNEVHRALSAVNSNSEFIIPVQAFFEPGLVKLSVELSNGTNRPTCNACFLIVTHGAKDVDASVLPSEKTWQEYVDSYLAKARQSALNDIENQHALAVSEISKLGDDTTSTISTKSASALSDIDSQREFAVSGINKIGNDTLSSISAKAASTTNDIDNKANDAIASIPSDYASLTSKVSSLKLYRDNEGYLCEEE